MPTAPPTLPPEHPMDSPRAILAQALKFGGLILTCAGAAALIRTGERSVFYALMMPAGMGAWFIGFRMLGKIAMQIESQQFESKNLNANHPQQNNQSPQN